MLSIFFHTPNNHLYVFLREMANSSGSPIFLNLVVFHYQAVGLNLYILNITPY
jgi:hypothetical protein